MNSGTVRNDWEGVFKWTERWTWMAARESPVGLSQHVSVRPSTPKTNCRIRRWSPSVLLRTSSGTKTHSSIRLLRMIPLAFLQRTWSLWGLRGDLKEQSVHPCVSLSMMAVVCHFPKGFNKRTKNNKRTGSACRMFLVKSSPLVSTLHADSCTADEKQRKKTTTTTTWLRISHPPVSSSAAVYWYCLEWFTLI